MSTIKRLPEANQKWKHHSGKQYTVICVTNLHALDHAKFPATVVYTDGEYNWSRPVEEFLASFKRS